MQYLKHAWLAILALLAVVILFFNKCSGNHISEEIRVETIHLNNPAVVYEKDDVKLDVIDKKTIFNDETTNPKTQYIKGSESINHSQKVVEVKHEVSSKQKDTELVNMRLERDEAINVTLAMKKSNKELKAQNLGLSAKVERLVQDQTQNSSSLKGKIAASAVALLAAHQLTADKDTDIEKLIKERDEAIKVTLEMEKANKTLKSQISNAGDDVNVEIQTLKTNIEKDRDASQRLLEKRKREIDRLTNDLAHSKDQVQKEIVDKQNAKDELAKLIKQERERQTILKDKLAISSSALATEKGVISDKDGEISRLTHDIDNAQNSIIDLNNKNKSMETANLQQVKIFVTEIETLKKKVDKSTKLIDTQSKEIEVLGKLKEKMSLLESSLVESKTLITDKNSKIEKLIKDRDEAIKITEELKKSNQDLDVRLTKLNDEQSISKEKIALSAAALLTAQQLTASGDKDIGVLTKERDEAIKISKDLNSQKITLHKKIEILIGEQAQKESELKKKVELSESALSELRHSITDKNREIKTLIKDRDEAINVSLNLKKSNQNLDVKLAKLNEQQTKNQSISKEKIALSASALLAAQQLTASRDTDISKLSKERDEAIRVTLEMQKASQDLEAKKVKLSKEIAAAQAELLSIKKSINDKDMDLKKIIIERDEAIKVTLGMQKENKILQSNLYKAGNIVNSEIQTLQSDIKNDREASQKLLKQRQIEIDKLKNALDSSKVESEKALKTLQTKITQSEQKRELEKKESYENTKKLVIDQIVSSFKLSKVEFKTSSAILTKQSMELLDRVADIMKNHSEYNYKIQGHTDSSGNETYNLNLSKERAKSVKSYLISKGVSDGLLSSDGFGSASPIADNKTVEGRVKNRRVVFEIVD